MPSRFSRGNQQQGLAQNFVEVQQDKERDDGDDDDPDQVAGQGGQVVAEPCRPLPSSSGTCRAWFKHGRVQAFAGHGAASSSRAGQSGTTLCGLAR